MGTDRSLTFFALMVAFIGAPRPADACSCNARSPQQWLDSSTDAFVGAILARDATDYGVVLRVRVDAAWKRSGVTRDEYVVTASNEAGCGLDAGVGARLVVFAHRDACGLLDTSLCEGTHEIDRPGGWPMAPISAALPAPTPITTAIDLDTSIFHLPDAPPDARTLVIVQVDTEDAVTAWQTSLRGVQIASVERYALVGDTPAAGAHICVLAPPSMHLGWRDRTLTIGKVADRWLAVAPPLPEPPTEAPAKVTRGGTIDRGLNAVGGVMTALAAALLFVRKRS